MSTPPPSHPPRREPAARFRASIADLQRVASNEAKGLLTVYQPDGAISYVEKDTADAAPQRSFGTQEILNLGEDLLLIRTDWRCISEDFRSANRWSFDNRGWLYLHFRLEGDSEEETPDGVRRHVDGECFLLSASMRPRPFARDLLGDSWRTVGIGCRPSFLMRDVPVAGDTLPRELQRFQSGDADVDFFYSGRLTGDMKSAVTTLLRPSVQGAMRPLYMQAKVVELVCLALDRVQDPERPAVQPLRLTRRDVACLHEVRMLLAASHVAPSLDALARRVGLNRRKLALGFKQVHGVTIGAWHRERRLAEAHEMLERGGVSIGCAAGIAGYSDAGSFSKAFRARYGCLPSDLTAGRRPTPVRKVTPARN